VIHYVGVGDCSGYGGDGTIAGAGSGTVELNSVFAGAGL